MERKLKVYGWQGWRTECPKEANGSHATREICAAVSKRQVANILGKHRVAPLEMSRTGNAAEIAKATSDPWVVFWKPLDSHADDWTRGESA